MIRVYTYEIIKSKRVIGTVTLTYPAYGETVEFPEFSMLKQPYNKKRKTISVPIKLITTDDGVTITMKRVLDVTKKSERQIELINKNYRS